MIFSPSVIELRNITFFCVKHYITENDIAKKMLILIFFLGFAPSSNNLQVLNAKSFNCDIKQTFFIQTEAAGRFLLSIIFFCMSVFLCFSCLVVSSDSRSVCWSVDCQFSIMIYHIHS